MNTVYLRCTEVRELGLVERSVDKVALAGKNLVYSTGIACSDGN
jgi:hypothetical protein